MKVDGPWNPLNPLTLVTCRLCLLCSANVEISGKMMVDAHFTKIGVHVNATTFSSTSLGGEIEYEEGKKFRVNIDVPEKPIDIFNYT